MKNLAGKVGRVLSFAHLLGAAAAEEDDPKKKRDDETDAEYQKRVKKLEGDEDPKKQRDGESDEDYQKRLKKLEEDEGEEGADDSDEDSEEEMSGNNATAAARRRERARCAAIFACAEAAVRPDMAAHLAFGTTMSRKAAIDVLKAAAAGGRPRGRNHIDQRMAGVELPNPGSGGGTGAAESMSAEGLARRMEAAYNRALGVRTN